jgi:hypothetical protein
VEVIGDKVTEEALNEAIFKLIQGWFGFLAGFQH